MSKTQQAIKVPSLLIQQCGTSADTLGLIGKRIRITQDSQMDIFRAMMTGKTEPDVQEGAEGVVIHIDAEGCIWADFGDDSRVTTQHTPEGDFRMHAVGNVDTNNDEFVTLYEVIEE